ncbi:MAG TPA: hypothetical protein VGH23_17850 [Rhizomicrobium sp.]
MTKMVILIAACSFVFSAAALADVYKLDTKGKCHDDHGKFAKQALCEQHMYKLDSKGKCRDEHGKFAEGKLCHA